MAAAGLALCLGSSVVAPPPASAGMSDETRCTVAQRKAAAKYAASLLACEGKAAKAGGSVTPACADKAWAKFQQALAKAEDAGGCPQPLDPALVAMPVEEVNDASAAALTEAPGDPRCRERKLRAIGDGASRAYKALAKFPKNQNLRAFQQSFEKVHEKLDKEFDKADAKGSCENLMASDEAVALVDPLFDQLQETGPFDWFMLAGQSNMVGASTQETPVADGLAIRAVRAPYSSFYSLEDPEIFVPEDTKSRGSPWPAFAQARDGLEALIAVARGANCLLDWTGLLPPERIDNANAAWDPDIGEAYANAVQAWEAAGRPPLRAFLYHQGECDAGVSWELTTIEQPGTSQDHYDFIYPLYKAALMKLADAVLRDFGVPMVAAPISLLRCQYEDDQGSPGWPDIPCSTLRPASAKFYPVWAAIVDAAAEHPNILLGPELSDLRLVDGIHVYDVNELGRRWADVVP